jgi:hypothetical protein
MKDWLSLAGLRAGSLDLGIAQSGFERYTGPHLVRISIATRLVLQVSLLPFH